MDRLNAFNGLARLLVLLCSLLAIPTLAAAVCVVPADCNDSNPCTEDSCNQATGICTNSPSPTGTACGDPNSSVCDNPDSCDGIGNCDANHQPDGFICGDQGIECLVADSCLAGACQDNGFDPAGTACGDGTATDCDDPDSCDGLGNCKANLLPPGTACGNPADTECDNPDSCDGSGLCDPNPEPDLTSCGDPGSECVNQDTCVAGACQDNGFQPAGSSCGDPSDTQCTNPDTCDGSGLCGTNDEADGTNCGDTGTDCVNQDTCMTGSCQDNGLQPSGSSCGDPSFTECDNPDFCDGAGTCNSSPKPAGIACGDPSDTECDNPDICDGGGICIGNPEPDGAACGDPGDECQPPDSCLTGSCQDHGFEPDGTPCGDPSDGECHNPDTCQSGICDLNLEPDGTSCGDPGTDCVNQDTCAAGSCQDNGLHPDGSACGDPGNTCTPADTCSAGSCQDNGFEPAGTACGSPATSECDDPDSCDGSGVCLANPAICRGTLFGAAHPGDQSGPSTLYKIDPLTGVPTAVGPIGFNSVEGIDFHPFTRILYGVGRRPADGVEVLVRIDPDTGAGSEIGPLITTLPGGRHFDVSFRDSDGTLFLTAINPGSCVALFTVDLSFGIATPVGDTGTCDQGNALGFSLGDTLFHADDAGPGLYITNPFTGASNLDTILSYGGFPFLSGPRTNSIDFRPTTGEPFVSVDDGTGGSGPNYLASLVPASGQIIHIGSTIAGLRALAWRPGGQQNCFNDSRLLGSAHSGGVGAPSTLYEIDPGSGAPTPIGPIGFDNVGALDRQRATGIIYGVGRRASDGVAVLLTVDPSTGAGTEIGPLVNTDKPGDHFDLSFRNSDGTLFLAAMNPAPGSCVALFEVSLVTGEATLIGNTTTCDPGNGLAFSTLDTLFHADQAVGGLLYTVDPGTGSSTPAGALAFLGFPGLASPRLDAIDYRAFSPTPYVSVNDGTGGTGPNYLATLNPSTGTVAHIGTTVSGLDALVWTEQQICACDCLFGTAHSGGATGASTLFSIDPQTGITAAIGPVGFNSVGGLDIHPVTGVMYGTGRRVSDGVPVLIEVDPNTGAGIEVGPLVNPLPGQGPYDLSFRNSDNTLFLTGADPVGCPGLFTVDLAFGTATLVGSTLTCAGGNALGYSGADILYHADSTGGGSLNRLDPATGLVIISTAVSFSGFPPLTTPRLNGMDFQPTLDGAFVSVNDGTGGGGPNYLASLDTTTGIVTHIGRIVNGLDALAWQKKPPGSTLFGQLIRANDAGFFTWTNPAEIVWVRGNLSEVNNYGIHLATPAPGTTLFLDPDFPPIGQGFFYVVREDCPAGSWSSGGSGECATPAVCPPGGRDGNLP